MTRAAVIGASGLVGEHLVKVLRSSGQDPITTFWHSPIPSAIQVDIAEKTQVRSFFESERPEVVFLPAALTNVDYCEAHAAETYRINVLGVKHCVDAANLLQARLIYFSTDYIFDGIDGPYSEAAAANPVSEYGRQKLMAEHYVSLLAEQYLIIRTTVVFGWERQGKNFVHRLLQSLKQGNPVNVPIDQIGSPTYASDLAQIAIELSSSTSEILINVAGPERVSRYEFARAIAGIFNLYESLINPVKTEELGQPARRPLNAGLQTAKVSKLTKTPLMNYAEALRSMLRERTSA